MLFTGCMFFPNHFPQCVFTAFGNVVELRINTKGVGGKLPNFGFVVFDDSEPVQKILLAKVSRMAVVLIVIKKQGTLFVFLCIMLQILFYQGQAMHDVGDRGWSLPTFLFY